MSAETPRQAASTDYGLPPRPPTASTPLWEHLMKSKGSSAPSLRNMPLIAPPSGPLDKNATSMKILLHDTQANFEKFGKHAAELLEEVKTTRHEIKTVHTLFQRDRECLMGDIVDLVNRSQKELQKTIGQPSQSDSVEGFIKDINHRLSELDQRLDAIQAFNQSHTQNLQTQIQAVQILLDKQGSIMTAVLPLLPLLQAVPMHIDAMKSNLQESLMRCMSWRNSTSLTSGPSLAIPGAMVATPSEPVMEGSLGKRKRTDKPGTTAFSASSTTSPSGSTSTDMPSNKRSRMQNMPHDLATSAARQPSTPFIERLASVSPSHPLKSDSSTRKDAPILSGSPALDQENPKSTFSIPATSTTTPRKPLTDLLAHLSSNQLSARNVSKRVQQRSASREVTAERFLTTLACGNTSTTSASSSNAHNTHMTPTAARPPRLLRVQSSFTRRLSTTTPAPFSPASAITNNDKSTGFASVTDPLPLPPTLREDQSHCHGSSTSVVSSPRQISASPMLSRTGTSAFSTAPISSSAQAGTSNQAPRNSATPRSANIGLFHTWTGAGMGFVKPKERRSPVREGRRFIPLVDSEDEEEEQEGEGEENIH